MAAHFSTLKTVLGFYRSFFGRRLPFGSESDKLEDIYNYLLIDDLYATSGQPSENQLRVIGEAGYNKVINLAPTSTLENSVVNEAEILDGLGIEYVHIPVDFTAPSDEDFDQFVSAVESGEAGRVWVHCAANMRVSAFTYRYRRSLQQGDASGLTGDLHSIWEPVGVWKEFIGR